MPHIENKKVLPCSIYKTYEVISDVTKYSEFIPWCKSVKIISDENSIVISDVKVEFLFIKEKYRSMTKFMPPKNSEDYIVASAEITMIEGPFKHFSTLWRLKSIGENRTIVTFTADFSFDNNLYNNVAEMVVNATNQKIIDAFTERVLRP